MSEKYWTVEFKAYAFDSKEEADRFHDALLDAFMAMPEAVGIASSSTVIEQDADDD